MVYLWEIPNEYPERFIGDYDRKNSPDRFLFKKGEVLPLELRRPIINYDASIQELRQSDDLSNNSMIPVVSKRLAEALLKFSPNDIQLIDVLIAAQDGLIEDYKILNIVNKVIGINKDESQIIYISGTSQIRGFKYLSYQEGCLKEHHLARDAEYSSNLLISEQLAEHLLTLKLKNVGLYLPDQVYGPK